MRSECGSFSFEHCVPAREVQRDGEGFAVSKQGVEGVAFASPLISIMDAGGAFVCRACARHLFGPMSHP